MALLHGIRHALRRIAQTRAAFDNPWSVVTGTALGNLRLSGQDVRFEVKGLSVVAPARRGAVFPVYEVFAEDTYRMSLLTTGLPPRPRVLDIGAHIGSFSVAMALAVPDAEIWAYEASPATAAYLRATVAASRLQNRVHVHADALAAEAGTVTLNDVGVGSPLNSTTKDVGTSVVAVPAVTLADAFERCQGSVDVVKVDAEGIEYDLLLLSEPSLWGSVSRVVIEYHDVDGHSPDQIIDRLAGLGLVVKARQTMVGNPREGMIWFVRSTAQTGR